MKRILAAVGVVVTIAVFVGAQPITTGGLQKVNHTAAFTGSGTNPSPLDLTHACTNGQALTWNSGSASWQCSTPNPLSGLTTNQTVKAASSTSIANAWPADDAVTWGVPSKFTITEASGNFRSFGTGTIDGVATLTGGFTLGADSSAASHKITNLTNGSSAQDAAAFGQIASAISSAGISGLTTNRVLKAASSSTIGMGNAVDDGSTFALTEPMTASSSITDSSGTNLNGEIYGYLSSATYADPPFSGISPPIFAGVLGRGPGSVTCTGAGCGETSPFTCGVRGVKSTPATGWNNLPTADYGACLDDTVINGFANVRTSVKTPILTTNTGDLTISPNGFSDTYIGNAAGSVHVQGAAFDWLTNKLTIDSSGNIAALGTLTADGGLRVFDAVGTGLSSSTNTVSLNINGGSTQTCTAGSFATSITSAGVQSCTASGLTGLTTNRLTKNASATTIGDGAFSDDATTFGKASIWTVTESNGNEKTFGTFESVGATTLSSGGGATTVAGNFIMSQAGDTYFFDSLATSSGNQSLNISAAGTGTIRFQTGTGGITNAGTGGLALHAGGSSTSNVWTMSNAGTSVQSGGATFGSAGLTIASQGGTNDLPTVVSYHGDPNTHVTSNEGSLCMDGLNNTIWINTNSASAWSQLTTTSTIATTYTGLGMFGDGNQGSVTWNSGTTTLTKDIYATDITCADGAIVITAGFIIYDKGAFTGPATSASGGCIIRSNGSNGTSGTLGSSQGIGGTGATASALPGGKDGGNGGNNANGGNSTNPTFPTDYRAGCGGSGGGDGTHTGGTCTVTVLAATNGSLNTLFHVVNGGWRNISGGNSGVTGAGGGGGGASGTTISVGVGGGGGGGGGFVVVVASKFTNPTNITIQANGGNGANGLVTSGNAGGGGGGGGGYTWAVCASGTAPTLQANGGTKGTGAGASGANGVDGNAGKTSSGYCPLATSLFGAIDLRDPRALGGLALLYLLGMIGIRRAIRSANDNVETRRAA